MGRFVFVSSSPSEKAHTLPCLEYSRLVPATTNSAPPLPQLFVPSPFSSPQEFANAAWSVSCTFLRVGTPRRRRPCEGPRCVSTDDSALPDITQDGAARRPDQDSTATAPKFMTHFNRFTLNHEGHEEREDSDRTLSCLLLLHVPHALHGVLTASGIGAQVVVAEGAAHAILQPAFRATRTSQDSALQRIWHPKLVHEKIRRRRPILPESRRFLPKYLV